ncbi:hypothetical protein TCON_0333 [Astathelohania contejeani]|uniref:Uncharacterized protein n=1 Tax=Astathelohania contejeani TaxID=164912 RepID=A0ABQ7I1Y1_9MICR|nr:hypothetical protein TCON_0333 [Thelohania contejeani]
MFNFRYFIIKDSEFTHLITSMMLDRYFFTNTIYENYPSKKSDIIIGPYTETYEYEVLDKICNNGFEEIYIATAYLNFPVAYLELIKDKNITVLTGRPDKIRFKHAGLFNKWVGEAYLSTAIYMLEKYPHIKYREYNEIEGTFHCKGK